ncbi:hypothetical protein [Methylobacterium sp. J-068]|nr:hypothetical protein [Methylobacterium sp. J-068]
MTSLREGVRVGLGVDGSASNDGFHIRRGRLRQAKPGDRRCLPR